MTAPPGDGEEDTRQHELVIIRRRGGGEEAPHKGGVWKIAHADFMTALMAFFLVMWLINATDEKTVKGVANYFNPMRLTDQTGKPKGVFTMDPGGAEQENTEHGAAQSDKHAKPHSDKASEKARKAEATLLSNADEELDSIAAEAHKAAADLSTADKGPELAHSGGELYRDPFDPDSRYVAHQGEVGPKAGGKDGAGTVEVKGEASDGQGDPSLAQSGHDGGAKGEVAAAELQQPIEEVVKQSGFDPIPGIEVRSTEQGLLIAITDQPNFEMFGISSARPKPELVVLMEKIGKILVDRPEHLVIRGHTDGRRYKSGVYDNWRLSAARAQMAYYMLVRGGVAEARVERIEGHADHDLKVVERPLAAENRRIEILLLKDKS
jgi:chemotaxis protein MotB